MKRFLTYQNFYTLLLVGLLYIIFFLLFLDVLQGKPFSLGITTIGLLGVIILFTLWTIKKFLKHTSKELSNTSILLILFSSLFLSLVLQKSIIIKETVDMSQTVFDNPLYSHYAKIANKYDLDLSFSKKVWEQRGPHDYKINHIFHQPKKSIDIIFFGDSSISWGMIPQVIEQLTGKKVAMYAYESNLLSENTSLLFDKIAQYYLKDDGVVIFSFDIKNMQRTPKSIKVSEESYYEILDWEEKDFDAYTDQNIESFYNKYISFDTFQRYYTRHSEYLKSNYHLVLQSPSIYRYYIEKMVNPKLAKAKALNDNHDTKFIRWDMRTVTEFNPRFMDKAFHDSNSSTIIIDDNNTHINAQGVKKIYGKRKLYMVPLYNNTESYMISRSIYQSAYKDLGFELFDLGVALKDNTNYTMQSDGTVENAKTHMANTGGLMKSILIGQWLAKYLSKTKN